MSGVTMEPRKGKILNTRNISLAITKVTRWYALGVALGVEPYKLEEIRLNHRNNVFRCKMSLIQHLLENDPELSWQRLADALADSDYRVDAECLRVKYQEGRGRARSKEGKWSEYAHPSKTGASTSVTSAFTAHSNEFTTTITQQLAQQTPAVVTQPVAAGKLILQDKDQGSDDTDSLESQGFLYWLFCGSTGRKSSAIVKDSGLIVELLRDSCTPEKLVRMLTHGKLDAHYVGPNGMTLLHYAVIYSNVDCLKGLIAFRGPAINPFNTSGLTPLELASMEINPSGRTIAVLLRSIGAKCSTELLKPPTWLPKSKASRMLTLSGIGSSAIVQIEILQQLEMHSGRRIQEMFDWIAASGLVALLLLVMVYGRQTLADVRRLYFKLQEDVFSLRTVARRSQALDSLLQDHLGTEMKLSCVQHPKILISTLNKTTEGVERHIFNNYLQDRFSDVPVWKVARYTCSQPPTIAEKDGYTNTNHSYHDLSAVGLSRARAFYADTQKSTHMVSSVVRLGAGQYRAAAGDGGQGSESMGAEEHTFQPCSSVETIQEVRQFNLNPALSRPLTLSLNVGVADIVAGVVDTMRQVSGETMNNLVSFLQQSYSQS